MRKIVDHPVRRRYIAKPGKINFTVEDTPDGTLTTPTWEGGPICVLTDDLVSNTPMLFDFLPWPLKHLWHDEANGERYYQRMDI